MKSIIIIIIAICTSYTMQANNFIVQRDTTLIDTIQQEIKENININEKNNNQTEVIDFEGLTAYFSLDEDINFADVTQGATLDFTARSDVKNNHHTFVEKGAIAEGEIIEIEFNQQEMPTLIKVQLKSVLGVEGNGITIKSKTETFRFNYEEEKGIIRKGKNMSGKLTKLTESTEVFKREKPTINVPTESTKIKTITRLYNGATIDFETTKTYKSDELTQGKIIPLRVLTPIKINNVTVIAYEAIATAEITQISTSAFGKEIELKIVDVTAIDGQKIPLRATLEYDEKDFLHKLEMSATTRTAAEIVSWK
jgi:hypothetical protein